VRQTKRDKPIAGVTHLTTSRAAEPCVYRVFGRLDHWKIG
jgi:hypothetical protein